LARSGKINRLEDLPQAEFITYAMLPDAIALTNGKEDISFKPENIRIEVNSIGAGKEAALAGLGVLHLPASEVQDEIDAGALVELKIGWSLPTLGVYAVWPDTGAEKHLTRRLVDFLAAANLKA